MTPDYAMNSALPPGDFQMNRYTTTPFGAQQYDANGNLVVRASAASPTFYHYDYADRLVEVDGLSGGAIGPVATFTYDALGNRISKTTYPGVPAAPVTVQYVHKGATEQCDDGNIVIEERVGGVVSQAFVHASGLKDEIRENDNVVFDTAGNARYYHCDDLGNTLALTDAGGNVLERYAYDDYGQPQFLDANGSPIVGSDGQPVTASPLGNPFLFQGLEWDGETGLLGDGGGNYFDLLTASAVRGKVKTVKDMGHGRAFEGNNPWSGSSLNAKSSGHATEKLKVSWEEMELRAK
jgi:YD repeat-containing protein